MMSDDLDDAADESFLPEAVVDAIEEVWQNQTYIPIKGWGAPFTGPAHYSDVSGERALSNDGLPDTVPLEG
jgi:hypothetical protein